MKVEHIAFTVDDPDAVADWYCKHLGMKLVRKGPPPVSMRFVADDAGTTMFEIYHQDVETPDYASMNPFVLHFAFYADDIVAERKRLLAAGATAVGEIMNTDAGDQLAMLRDPWGLPVQLVHRSKPML